MDNFNGYALLMLTSLLTSGGQLCQKQASNIWQGHQQDQAQQGHPQDPAQQQYKRKLQTIFWLMLACACLGLGMLCWLFVLRSLPVSQAYPMLSLNFVLVVLAAKFWFGEVTTPRQWGGILAIMLGVALLGVS